MGLYPDYTKRDVTGTGWVETRHEPGVKFERTITCTPWVEVERTDCYCCSCDPERQTADPFCRNHGWVATRPCETHNMPGEPNDDDVMPLSVQRERLSRRSSSHE